MFLGLVIKNLDPFLLLGVNLLISGLLFIIFKKHVKKSITNFFGKFSEFSSVLYRTRDFFLYLILLLLLIQVTLLVIKIYYLPPHVNDVFSYHLYPVLEWVQQSKIPALLDTPVMRSNVNPLGAKLYSFWLLNFSRDFTWLELPQFFFGLILMLACYTTMLKIKIGKTQSLRYAILIYFIPSVLIGSRTCQDHLILTGLILVLIVYFIDVFYRRDYSQVFYMFLSIGLLLGIKISSPQVVFVVFVALLTSRGFRVDWLVGFIKQNKFKIIIGFLSVLLLSSYWFIKNTVFFKTPTGNPLLFRGQSVLAIFLKIILTIFLVFLLVRGFEKFQLNNFIKKHRSKFIGLVLIIVILGSYQVFKNFDYFKVFLSHNPPTSFSGKSFSPELPLPKLTLAKNILYFPHRIKDTASFYTPDLPNISGFGIQFFVFGILSYIIFLGIWVLKKKYRDSEIGFLFCFSILLLISYFIYYFSPYSYRLLFFFPVLGIILWAFLVSKLNLKKYYLYYIDFIILVMILFNISVCFYEGNLSANNWKTVVTMTNSNDRTSIQFSTYLGRKDWQFIENYLKPDEKIAFAAGRDSWISPYFGNNLKRKIHNLKSMPGYLSKKDKRRRYIVKFSETLLNHLKEQQIKFIHINWQGTHKKERVCISNKEKHVIKVLKNIYYLK
jgi:hypothetical protein